MPITKKLVEKMGGTISFESKEGTGTTFVIRIPFQIDADMKDRNETEEKTETSIQGLHVLLTEDNELNMEIAEFVLQNEGAVPSLLSKEMVPPIFSTSFFVIGIPSPVPANFVRLPACSCANGSKMRFWNASVIPIPVSLQTNSNVVIAVCFDGISRQPI